MLGMGRWFGVASLSCGLAESKRLCWTCRCGAWEEFSVALTQLAEVGTRTLWMDKILHHLETMGNHCALAFTGESSFQGR